MLARANWLGEFLNTWRIACGCHRGSFTFLPDVVVFA